MSKLDEEKDERADYFTIVGTNEVEFEGDEEGQRDSGKDDNNRTEGE